MTGSGVKVGVTGSGAKVGVTGSGAKVGVTGSGAKVGVVAVSNGVICPVCMSLCRSERLLVVSKDWSTSASRLSEISSSLPDSFLRRDCSLVCSAAICFLCV